LAAGLKGRENASMEAVVLGKESFIQSIRGLEIICPSNTKEPKEFALAHKTKEFVLPYGSEEFAVLFTNTLTE